MGTKKVWDPVDPEDIIDLWFDFTALTALGRVITSQTVTAPAGVTLVDTAIDGGMVRFRQGPTPVGKYLIKCHIELDNGEERDVESTLTVKERVIRV